LTLTEALVGHPVIDGEPAAIMGTVLDTARRPTPGSEGVIVSDEVEHVFLKALAVDPRERYADAGVFWNELLAAARITSGEVQEVRLPRDARAEPGGAWVERVERVEVPRRQSVRPPNGTVPLELQAVTPTLALETQHAGANAAPVLRPFPPTPAPFPPAASGAFEVPDLDLAPVSRPSPPRANSGMRPAVSPPIDLEDASGDSEFGHGAALDLDLPAHDPFIRRASSGGMSAVRLSEPPAASLRSPVTGASYPPPERSASPPPVTITQSVPPAAPLITPTAAASVPPPVSRAGVQAAPGPATPVAVVRPRPKVAFRLKLSADADATLVERLLPGGVVLGGAILVTVLDQIYSMVSGEIFMLGPLRTSVLAGFVMLLGVGLCLYRLKHD
jgi:serine/threonine-protein kinase